MACPLSLVTFMLGTWWSCKWHSAHYTLAGDLSSVPEPMCGGSELMLGACSLTSVCHSVDPASTAQINAKGPLSSETRQDSCLSCLVPYVYPLSQSHSPGGFQGSGPALWFLQLLMRKDVLRKHGRKQASVPRQSWE